jgi:anti-sigma regulatory factor (Ser/Thr protein kinase)
MDNTPMDEKPHIRIELLSDPSYLAGVRQLIAGVSQRVGFDEASCSQVALAVDEALANIIRHGYCRACDRPIWISLWPNPETDDLGPGMRIEIEDEARQVDEAELCGRNLDDPQPGGLGLHIIREVMDEVTYTKRSKSGMRLTMVKYAPKGSGQPPSTPNGD